MNAFKGDAWGWTREKRNSSMGIGPQLALHSNRTHRGELVREGKRES
jgi:hypothetical protein